MRKLIIFFLLAVPTVAVAQQKPGAKPKAVSPSASSSDVNLPPEDAVNAFLHATFGYDPQLRWKIQSIKPSAAERLAEVDVLVSGAQGRGGEKVYVSRDGRHAVVGEIVPVGAHP